MKLSLIALVLIGGVLTLSASACSEKASADATVAIHYSRFEPELITATAGKPITITLRNDDPIAHEWMVGDAAMHERHRTGTEPYHDQIPTEVTIPSFSERVTTVVFDQPGDYAYICHLPGHEAYGMVGTLRVLPR
ncbi:MAG: cupredoxin domain-containing protein [Dehalococcoidia bacterium]